MIFNSKISIIIPCYNQELYLDECLKSVFQQTLKNWECIIVNDGSTDNSENIALKWINLDQRFIYLKKENGGLSSARNFGLQNASGDYIQFLDGDDTISVDKFEKQLSFFSDDIDIVISDYFPFFHHDGSYCSSRYLNPFPNEKTYKSDIIINWENKLSIPCHCILFKRSLISQNNILDFDQSLPNHEDWLFWVKLFYLSTGIHNLKEKKANYRIRNDSMCSDTNKMNQGFLDACDKVIFFFKLKNDLHLQKLAEQKKIKIKRSNWLISLLNYRVFRFFYRNVFKKIIEF